jgi:radical SAM protein with 4Fe4S-binding SPASM domain
VGFGIILVLNRANVGHPEEIVDFFSELGVNSIKINPINMIGDAQLTWDGMSITPDEYCEFLDTFVDCSVDKQVSLREYNLGEYLQHLIRRVHDYRCMRSNCGAGRSFFLIDAAGDVYPCAHSAGIPSWRLGKISDAPTGLAVLGAQNDIVQQFPRRLVEQIEDTRRCPWRHFCEGGCAVNAYQRSRTILAPDTLCSFYERFYPRLLERLASAPTRFQTLLDLTLGPQRASVVDSPLT